MLQDLLKNRSGCYSRRELRSGSSLQHPCQLRWGCADEFFCQPGLGVDGFCGRFAPSLCPLSACLHGSSVLHPQSTAWKGGGWLQSFRQSNKKAQLCWNKVDTLLIPHPHFFQMLPLQPMYFGITACLKSKHQLRMMVSHQSFHSLNP